MLKLKRNYKKKIIFVPKTKKSNYLHNCLIKHSLYINRLNVYSLIYDDREKDMRLLLKYRHIYLQLWGALNHIIDDVKCIIVKYINIKSDIY